MESILYMLRKTFKNGVIDTIRHPLRCIFYIMIIAWIVYGIISGFTSETKVVDEALDIRILSGAYLAILYVISIPIMLKGLSTGTSFFVMSDVTNIFVAPISQKKILIYGIGRQLVSMLVLVVCFISYGSMAINMFEVSISDIFILLAGIICTLVLVQFMTIFIFCVCHSNTRRSTFIKYIIYLLPLYTVGIAVIYMFVNGFTFETFLEAISLSSFKYVPFIGWLHGVVFGILNNNLFNIILFGSLLILSVIVCIITFYLSKLDYYEDVLQKTESNFEIRNSIKSGKVTDSMMLGNKKIKINKTGINHGKGAYSIFFKHIRENSRRSRFPFFNINTTVLIIISLVIGFAMKTVNINIPPTIIMLSVVIICSYIQFFFSASGDWVKELNKPYIYLIPDNPVKKLIMASTTSIVKPFSDSFITFVILGICVQAYIIDILTSILVYTSFGCVYIASNMIAQRAVGIKGSRGIFMTFYMSMIFLLLLPGIILGVTVLAAFAGIYPEIAATLMGVPVFVWNFFISFMIFFICRNLLNKSE